MALNSHNPTLSNDAWAIENCRFRCGLNGRNASSQTLIKTLQPGQFRKQEKENDRSIERA